MAATIEVFGHFGSASPKGWRTLERGLALAQAKLIATSLTSGHYLAARVRYNGQIVHQSGADVVAR